MKNLIKLVDEHLDKYMPIVYPEDIFKAMKYTLMLPGKYAVVAISQRLAHSL